MLFTLFQGIVVDARKRVELDELTVDGGEEKVFAVLDARCPEREATDRVGDAPELAFGLKIKKGECERRPGADDLHEGEGGGCWVA